MMMVWTYLLLQNKHVCRAFFISMKIMSLISFPRSDLASEFTEWSQRSDIGIHLRQSMLCLEWTLDMATKCRVLGDRGMPSLCHSYSWIAIAVCLAPELTQPLLFLFSSLPSWQCLLSILLSPPAPLPSFFLSSFFYEEELWHATRFPRSNSRSRV